MLTKKRTLIQNVILLAAASMIGCSGPKQKTISLTVVDGYPTQSLWVREFIDYYIPEVDKRLAATGNHEIKWTQAWVGKSSKQGMYFRGYKKV